MKKVHKEKEKLEKQFEKIHKKNKHSSKRHGGMTDYPLSSILSPDVIDGKYLSPYRSNGAMRLQIWHPLGSLPIPYILAFESSCEELRDTSIKVIMTFQ